MLPQYQLGEAELLQEPNDVPIEVPLEDPVDSAGRVVYDKPFTDHLIHAEVLLPQGEEIQSAKVQGRSKDIHGNSIGTFLDSNPILTSIVCDFEFLDGAVKQYAAKSIAENMYTQLDHEGYSQSILESIIDFKTDGNAVTKDSVYVVTKSG